MAKKHWGMIGKPKKEPAKVSKTMADVGLQYKKLVGTGVSGMTTVQAGLPGKIKAAAQAQMGGKKGVVGMGSRKKGWKRPGKRGIMGL